jgi:2',3'-cyclic-nucleotide 2'-phosphodiesterase (5'-nucleotidase family)
MQEATVNPLSEVPSSLQGSAASLIKKAVTLQERQDSEPELQKAPCESLHQEEKDRAEISAQLLAGEEKPAKEPDKKASSEKAAPPPSQPEKQAPHKSAPEIAADYNQKPQGSTAPKQVEVAATGALVVMDEMTPQAPVKSSCRETPRGTKTEAPGPNNDTATVTLLHTNDMHGYLTGEEGAGSFSQVAAKAREIAQGRDNVLYLDAGDSTEGTKITNDAQGKPMIEAMDTLDGELARQEGKAGGSHKVISTIGNHEAQYDSSDPDALKKNLIAMQHPVVCCNLRDRDGNPLPNTKPYEMVTFRGKDGKEIRAAVVGVTTPELRKKHYDVGDPAEEVKKAAAQAKGEGADMVIVLSHCGLEEDRKIAAGCPEVNVIVGGHSHDRASEKVGDTLIVQAGSNARSLGELDLTIDTKTKKIIAAEHTMHQIDSSMKRDEKIDEIAKKYDKAEYHEILGHIDEELPITRGDKQESRLGNAFADKMREQTGTEIAFYNKNTLREGLKKGDITAEQAYSAYPYERDQVVTGTVSGKMLKDIFERSLTQDKLGGIYNVSGMRVEFEGNGGEDGHRIKSIKVERKGPDGAISYEEIKDDQPYRISTLSYVMGDVQKEESRDAKKRGIEHTDRVFGNVEKAGKGQELFFGLLRDSREKSDRFNVSTDRVKDLSCERPDQQEKVACTAVPLINPAEKKETNLGNFIADTVKTAALAVMGLFGKKSVRSGIEMGDISRRQLYEAYPHNDKVLSGDFTGGQIQSILEKGLSKDGENGGSYAVSGMELTYDSSAHEGRRLKEVTLGGEKLDAGKTYRVGFTDYAATHIEGFMEGKNIIDHGKLRDHIEQRAQQSLKNPFFMHVASNRTHDIAGDPVVLV